MSEKSNIISIFEEYKKKERKKGAQKKGGENSPVSPPLDPRLLPNKVAEQSIFYDGCICTLCSADSFSVKHVKNLLLFSAGRFREGYCPLITKEKTFY